MPRGASRGLALIAAACLAGCGTILQPIGEGPAPYGGVRWDVDVIRAQWGTGPEESTSKSVRRRIVTYPLLILDLPLSLVADTLLFPYALFNQIGHWIDDQPLKVMAPKWLYAPGPF